MLKCSGKKRKMEEKVKNPEESSMFDYVTGPSSPICTFIPQYERHRVRR